MTYKILVLLLFISANACGQITLQKTSSPFLFIDSIFNKENYTIEIIDFEYPKELQEISLRAQKAMEENKKWFEEYFSKNYKAGEGLPYHEKFGITKDEYQKIKDIAKIVPNVVIKKTALLKANRALDVLSFEAIDSGAEFFESLEIDFKKETLIFFKDTIPFSHEISASKSALFGQLHGYCWKKENSNLSEKDDLKTDSLVSKIVEINIEKLQTDNKVLFSLKYKEVDKGEVKANFEILCYLN